VAPVAYIEQVRRMYPNEPPYQWTANTTSPWTPMTRPIRESRIALISSGGMYHRTQQPFESVKNDLTFREIPKAADLADLRISHYSKNAVNVKDLNTIFPLDRFKELEAEGIIGELVSPAFTFMGRIFMRTKLQKEMAPHLIGRLREMATDVTSSVRPPRAVFVNFPLGHQVGKPFDPGGQTRIILDALHVLETAPEPGTLVQLQYKWDENDPLDSWEEEEMLHPSAV
jgi:D-proline reductase (dithiol) PrdB